MPYYIVKVKDEAGKGYIDSETFPVGEFHKIGYWLDNCGYIAEGYTITITVKENDA